MIKIYQTSWNVINGLSDDITNDVLDDSIVDYIETHGIYDTGHRVYYVNSKRDIALKLIMDFINQYVTKCKTEHELLLDNARTSWRQLKSEHKKLSHENM